MNIRVHSRSVELTEAIRAWAERRVLFALGQFGARVRSVAVRLSDENGPKGGPDQRCVMEARVSSAGSVVAEVLDADLYAAISRAAGRLGRRVRGDLERAKSGRRGAHGAREARRTPGAHSTSPDGTSMTAA